MLKAKPIELKDANEFVKTFHRHHPPVYRDKNQTRIHLPTSADFTGRGSSYYIRYTERLQKGRLLVSGGSVECDGNFLGGITYGKIY